MLFRRRRERIEADVREKASTGFTVLDQRLPLAEAAKGLLRKAFPDHWSFLLGELALYSFVLLVLTGSWLTLFFTPGAKESVYQGSYAPLRGLRMSQAYESTLHISFDVRGGLLVRQMHHWAALVFVAAIAVHMLRIFFTGAFRKPREINWMLGVLLFFTAMLEGFCGYSLPDDLLSGTGLRTANTIVMSIPVVGTYLAFFAWGGPFPINRNVVGKPLFPFFTAKSTGLFFTVCATVAALAALAQINPVWLYGPFSADQVSTDAQPDWYVGFLEGGLRLMPPWETTVAGHTVMWNVLLPAVVMPGLLLVPLFCYPMFERWVTGDRGEHNLCDRPRDRPTRTAFGVAGIVWYAVLLAAGGNDVTAFTFRASINALTWIFRIAVIVAPVLAFLVTKRMCLALQSRERHRLTQGEETGEVVQSVYGAIAPQHEPVEPERLYHFLARDLPPPAPVPAPGTARRDRLRAALNRWYYRRRVEMPATEEQRRHIEHALAEPDRRTSS